MIDETPEVNAEDLNLDDVVGMEPDALTDVHKEYLNENKGNLTPDQQSKFGFGAKEEVEKEAEEEKPEEKPEVPAFDPNSIEPGVKNPIKFEIEDDDDDDMDAEDKARINKQVAKGSKGLIERQQLIEDTQSVNNIISDAPELKSYKGLTLKYMASHPTLTAEDAMKIASSGDQQRIGAEKERVAAKKAKDTQSGGSSYRSSGSGTKDWANASTAEIEAQIALAKGQR